MRGNQAKKGTALSEERWERLHATGGGSRCHTHPHSIVFPCRIHYCVVNPVDTQLATTLTFVALSFILSDAESRTK